MLTEIEEAIVARLNLKIAAPKRVDIDEAHTALGVPAIDVIVGGGSFRKVAQTKYELSPSVYVVVTFQHLRSVRDRRKGVYPILEAIAATLIGQKLGLAIDPLAPKRLDNITEKAEAEDGKIVFQLEFETGFILEKVSDEEITELLSVGFNYYLKPGDDVEDATDLVELREA
jgi:hypothetical protein